MHAFASQPHLPDMDKKQLLRLITEELAMDLEVTVRVVQTAHETTTHKENAAEDKYDILGLEATYLVAGRSRRVEKIRQVLDLYRSPALRNFNEERGIQLTALVTLLSADSSRRTMFFGPEAAGLRIGCEGREVLVITPRSPLGQSLIGRYPGDETRAKGPPLAVGILAVDWGYCYGTPQAPQNSTPAARSALQATQRSSARVPP